MTDHFSRWDSAEYLKTEEDIAEYLCACMNMCGDDPAFIAKALKTIAHAREAKSLWERACSRKTSKQRVHSGRTRHR